MHALRDIALYQAENREERSKNLISNRKQYLENDEKFLKKFVEQSREKNN